MARQVSFGVALYTGQRAAEDGRPMYQDAGRLAQAAEAAGFDVFWLSEHHGWADGYLPSPLVVAAAVAATTSRIRIGTGLAVAPLHNPVRLAEEAAVVDHLSNGRLILGLGAGYLPQEFRSAGFEWSGRGRRLEETVAVLRSAWTGRPFTHKGSIFNLDEVTVTPAPVQQPLPIWIGAYAPAAVERAGRVADGHLVGRAAPGVVQGASELLGRHRDPQDPSFTFGVNVSTVLEEPEGAPGQALEGYARQQLAYESVQVEHDAYAGRIGGRERARDECLALGDIRNYVQAIGDASSVVDQVAATVEPAKRWASLHVALRVIFPEPDVDAQCRRLAALGSRVLPALRAKLTL